MVRKRVEYRAKLAGSGASPYSNGSSGGVEIKQQQTSGRLPASQFSADDLVNKYADYGSTPPRTRLKIKNRDWERKQKMEATSSVKMKIANASRMSRSRVNRRNTMDCALLNEMFVEDETKRVDKRGMTLQREADRESKLLLLNLPGTIPERPPPQKPVFNSGEIVVQERFESMPGNLRSNRISGNASNMLIESSNRYMCVQSRPVEQIGCRMSAPPASFFKDFKLDSSGMHLQTRKAFHETFANLIKLGSVDKQEMKISQEEHKYQTELKDLIWLELQAWHADRTLDQQDKFLYAARQNVSELLQEIMDYKFMAKYSRNVSVISDDSGITSDSACSTAKTENEFRFPNNGFQFYSTHCGGCYSMYCKDCTEQQSQALKQVEILLTRLEAAESLFPSTCAMGQFFPLYKDEKFIGRVKAMCLWYNITRHQRLKLLILGRILARLQGKQVCWPVTINSNNSNSSLDNTDTDSGRDTTESKESSAVKPRSCKVQFDLDDDPEISSNDSSGSPGSSKDTVNSLTDDPGNSDLGKVVNEANLFNVQTLALSSYENIHSSANPYRKYIENVLKSRGLGKSLNFLHRLHNVVLRKARVTLEKPGSEEPETDGEIFDDEEMVIEPPLDQEEEAELRRFGVWSPEYAELNLPSYVSAFIFLSLIPMEVIHEFLRMKIESRPIKPNPLSLEQLLKELREGIILAITHRERFNKHITTALLDRETELEKYLKILDEFNSTLKTVFELYLDYVEQMIMAAASEGQQKATLDKEWMFTKLVCPMIPGQHAVAAKKFCSITRKLLSGIGDRLVSRAQELDEKILVTESSANEKMEILVICRETQSLFTVEREKSMRVMSFGKVLVRDIEHSDFHRDHTEEFLSKCKENDFVCGEVKEAVQLLKADALEVRNKLTEVIKRVQERCEIKDMYDMDEVDKIAVVSRTREILHQGYKFGFEYHRDVVRLLETKMQSCKSEKCAFSLSLGIISFAKMWMTFVMERCERGRGLRPRWAAQGFEFLIIACDPTNSKHLTEIQFEEMKAMMDKCISHVIGLVCEPQRKRPSPRARKSSPANRPPAPTSPTTTKLSNSLSLSTKSLLQQNSLREDSLYSTPTNSQPASPDIIRKQTSCDNSDHGITINVPDLKNFTRPLRAIRVRDSINRLDMELENRLRDRNLIGQVKSLDSTDKHHIRARSVTFRWHRGMKIGQGRFGKVYTAVNNSTGELMAMKEITIQPGENRAIQKVAEELKIFEGITHKHLVKYYGVEIHREELLIFMELCSEGTLESLVELSGGLHEGMTRRFTVQLLSAVAELHKHGIVHRDIKAANIFLTNGANCLKLGDFGCAAKIQSNTTMAGELQGLVGTQAYMAPEVFTRTNTEGHGRAADIWSVGCVTIEMASGKRPWHQFDSNVQIMFKVGMGQRPENPETLSQEGFDFLDKCLQHDPKDRWSASELLLHHFCKVTQDENCLCQDQDKEIRRSTRSKSKSFEKSPLKQR